MENPKTLKFGKFLLDTVAGELRDSSGRLIPLQPQPMRVLIFLAKRAGQLVSREELQQAVWGTDTIVDFDRGLNWCVRKIRQALADDATHPQYLETLPKRGYRFLAPSEPQLETISIDNSIRRSRVAFIPFLLAVVAATFAWFFAEHVHATTLVVLPFDNLTGNASQSYLADLATEQVITRIGMTGTLNVIDRATAAKMKREHECILKIGQQLHAEYVLQGSVVMSQGGPELTAGLYRVRDNTQLWAGKFSTNQDKGQDVYRELAAKVLEFARR